MSICFCFNIAILKVSPQKLFIIKTEMSNE